MLVLIRGAGDLATGIALRLFRSHLRVVMTDLPQPTAIRRTVCFSQAILYGSYQVEDVTAERAETEADVRRILAAGQIPVLADPRAACRAWLRPDVVVDAILAKKNLGTAITDAPLVIGVGPGFCAGKDCHAVIETMRGHTLGRVIRTGEPIPNTNIPGLIGGFPGHSEHEYSGTDRRLCGRARAARAGRRDIPSARRYRRTRAGGRCGRRGERQADGLHDRGRHPRDAGRRDAGL